MLARLGERLAALFRATAPDPFVIAILLTALTFILGVFFGADSPRIVDRPGEMLGYWQGGFWDLLAFAMQMSLILVTGHTLASSPVIARLLRRLSSIPRSGRQAVAMTSAVAICFGLINWGLGLIVGAILARDVGRAMKARGVSVPYPLLAAAGYTAMLCWHGGLSGSAPLQAASADEVARLVGADLAAAVGDLPASTTIFTLHNAVTTGGLLIGIPLLLALMCPKRVEGNGEIAKEPNVQSAKARNSELGTPPPELSTQNSELSSPTLPERLDRSPIVAWLLAGPALVWLALHFADRGLDGLTLNTANLTFFALGMVLHGSPVRYMEAATEAAGCCAGIIIQFPLYAGIMGMMRDSGMAAGVSRAFVEASGGSHGGLAVMTFLSAGLVNLFVPSGGGQWAIQAPVALQAAQDAGADPSRIVMAVAYGDQWTNMLQPFWALPLLGITGVKARDIVGYTAVALVAAGVWFVACLWLL